MKGIWRSIHDVKKLRVLLFSAGLLVALVPAVSLADGRTDVAVAKHKANVANDAARCSLAAEGAQLPGKVAPSSVEAAAACASIGANAEVRALQALPATTKITCTLSEDKLTGKKEQLYKAPLYAYLIEKAKAEKKGKTVPVPTENVLRLMAC
jgi:hypothetical protein